jgi:arylsulfatase A-like enzyme
MTRLVPPLVVALLLLASCGFEMPPTPNVIFLLTDDQRPDTIGALGNPRIVTPTLDELASSGFVFSNAYNLGSNLGAVCAPSRNMILSGRAYFRWEGRFAPPEPANLADSMRNFGYETYHHGKKGNTAEEIHKRFDHTTYLDPKGRFEGRPGQDIINAAIEFLSTRTDEKPFFMYLAFAAPHDPRLAEERYMDMYPAASMPLPADYLPVHPFDNGEMVIRDELLEDWPRTEDAIRTHLRDYYAVITALDEQIGRLITYLKENGLYEDTYIVFSSDQGLAVGSHGLMGKQNLYQHSARAPLIIAGPDIEPGKSDALVYLLDIYPTILSLVGSPPETGLDGDSLAPIVYGQAERVRKSLFLSYKDVQRAIRDERYKLIVYPRNGTKQLFDLETDPDERNNLAENPDFARRVEGMMAAIEQWQSQLGDTAPLVVTEPADPAFTAPTAAEAEKLRNK